MNQLDEQQLQTHVTVVGWRLIVTNARLNALYGLLDGECIADRLGESRRRPHVSRDRSMHSLLQLIRGQCGMP